MTRLLRIKLLAFLLIGVGTIGSVLRDRFEFGDSTAFEIFLAVIISLGLVLWLFSKVLEKQADKDSETDREQEIG